ncbi:MAG: PEP-CTERM sorting domain-containing protein [Verrucomicrobiota bacterium]|nr:PEP-CTERM sorting domain-containing protein [Verrucomicrobiota bacterium]
MKTPRITQILLALAALAFSPAAHALFVNPGAGDVVLGSGDDAVFPVGTLPAGFTFFGAAPGSLSASTNGNLNFGASIAFSNVGFPTTVGAGMIAPFWDDLIFPPGSFLLNNTVAGQLTVIWSGVGLFGLTGVTNTFEAVLLGTGNQFGFVPGSIVFSYGNMTGVNTDATVGITNAAGTTFATHAPLVGGSTNGLVTTTSLPLLSNKSFLYTPAGGTYVVTALIPEPSTYALAIAGLGLLGCMQRFRGSRKA